MDAARLRERISPQFIYYRRVLALIEEEQERLWQQGLPVLEYQDELDERHLAQGQSVRSSHNAQKRGVERLLRFFSQVGAKTYYSDFPEELQLKIANNLYEKIWQPRVTEHFNRSAPTTQRADRPIAQNRKDVRDNFLYKEWLRQANKPDGIKTYAVYALFTALKAVNILLTSRTSGEDLIRTFYTGELPDRERLLQVYETINLFSPSEHESIALLLSVPHMLPLAEAFIIRYSDIVRAERVDKAEGVVLHSPLPDDPLEASLPNRYEIPEATRFENGYQAYLAKEGSARAIAKRYDLPRDRFFEYLRGKGVEMRHGGDRKTHE